MASKLTSDGFRKVLERVRDEILNHLGPGATTWDINNGYCEEFADAVVSLVPEADAIYVAQLDPEHDPNEPMECPHVIVLWRGKLYDAECFQGIRDWRKLPMVRNQGKSRATVLQERKGDRRWSRC